MQVRHERPEDRLNFLVTAPLIFIPEGEAAEVQITRWSLDGVCLDEEPATEVSGPGVLKLPFQGITMDLPVILAPRSDDGLHGFQDITVRQRQVLSALYEGLMSGRMTSTEDMIQSLDTPVDLVPMEETETEKEAATATITRRMIRAGRTALVYTLTAALLFFGVGGRVWQRVDQLSPAEARVAAPLVEHYFTQSGQVREILIEPGMKVFAGDILVEVGNTDIDRRSDSVRARVRLAESQLEQARAVTAAQEERVRQHRRTLVNRFKSRELGDPAKTAAFRALMEFDRGIPNDQNDVRVVADNLRDREAEIQTRLRFAKRELGDLKDAEEAGYLRALATGTVNAVHIVPGLNLTAQTLGVTIEQDGPRTLSGFLSDRHADQVYVGMPAKVSLRIGPLRQTLNAEVVDFRLVPRGKADVVAAAQVYGLQVHVALLDIDPEQSRALLRPEAPARIVLYRQTRQRVVASLLGWIRS